MMWMILPTVVDNPVSLSSSREAAQRISRRARHIKHPTSDEQELRDSFTDRATMDVASKGPDVVESKTAKRGGLRPLMALALPHDHDTSHVLAEMTSSLRVPRLARNFQARTTRNPHRRPQVDSRPSTQDTRATS